MTLFLGIFSVVLLALVAGLLLTVGWWLYEFRQSYKKMPLLGEELTRQLMQARDALGNLQRSAKEVGPELATAVGDAQRLLQDLQFLTQRADELASKLELSQEEGAPITRQMREADDATIIESSTVITENVVAVASASRDPLEDLLEGLGEEKPAREEEDAEEEEEETPPRILSREERELRRKLAE